MSNLFHQKALNVECLVFSDASAYPGNLFNKLVLTSETVMSRLTKLKSLTLSLKYNKDSNFSFLGNLTNLSHLSLKYCDVSALKKLPKNIKSIEFTECGNDHDFSESNFEHLESFTLHPCGGHNYGNSIDESCLKKMQALTSLTLEDCSIDITCLEKLINLTDLDLSGCNSIADISPLEKLINLSNLKLASCYNLRDISPLKNLPNLKTLNILNSVHRIDVTQLQQNNPNLVITKKDF